MKKIRASQNTVLRKVVRNLYVKFLQASLIRNCFELKSGERKVLRRSRRYYFWINFSIFQSRLKTQIFRKSKCGFQQHIFIAQRNLSIIREGKGLLHWKALQINFEKRHFGKRLSSDIHSHARGTAQVFFWVFFQGKLGR